MIVGPHAEDTPHMPWSTRERVLFVLTLSVLALLGVLEAWNAACGDPIQSTVTECSGSMGSCKWRVPFALAADALDDGTGLSAGVARSHECREAALRDFAFFPGLLLYLLAPALAVLAAVTRRRMWLAVGSALVGAATLIRLVELGLFTAVMF